MTTTNSRRVYLDLWFWSDKYLEWQRGMAASDRKLWAPIFQHKQEAGGACTLAMAWVCNSQSHLQRCTYSSQATSPCILPTNSTTHWRPSVQTSEPVGGGAFSFKPQKKNSKILTAIQRKREKCVTLYFHKTGVNAIAPSHWKHHSVPPFLLHIKCEVILLCERLWWSQSAHMQAFTHPEREPI